MVRGTRFAAVSAAVSLLVGAPLVLAGADARRTGCGAERGQERAAREDRPVAQQSLRGVPGAAGKGVTAKAFKTKNKALRTSKGMVGIDAYATDGAALARVVEGARRHKGQGARSTGFGTGAGQGARPDRGALLAPLRAARARDRQCAAAASGHAGRRVVERSAGALPPTASTASGITVGTLSDSINCNPPSVPAGRADLDLRRGHRERRAADGHDDPRQRPLPGHR